MSRIGVTILASGSNANCTIIHCEEQAIMIDCGLSFRTLRQRLAEEGLQESWIKALLITHEHKDHVSGAKTLAKHLGIPIYATEMCGYKLQQTLQFGALTMIAHCQDFPLCGFQVRAFPVTHDAVDTVGYIVTRDSVKVGVATDLGQTNQMTSFQLHDCNTLVVESNYDLNMLAACNRPWNVKTRILSPIGHLSNDDTAKLLPSVVTQNTRNVILAHLSGDCNTREKAHGTAQSALHGLGRNDILLTCGKRDAPLETIWC